VVADAKAVVAAIHAALATNASSAGGAGDGAVTFPGGLTEDNLTLTWVSLAMLAALSLSLLKFHGEAHALPSSVATHCYRV
jgi:hypothetical protein